MVEGPRFFPERTATTEEAREEIRSTVPGGAEVVGETTIRESLGANLRNVLDFVPGVLVRPRFGLADESQFSIRGSGLQNNFHNRDVNFLFNSFLYGQADGFSDFESIELMDVKRIEVFKGANALRYGANSIGGAVNFVTKTGHDAGPFEYWGEGGSYGFFKQHLATGQVHGPFDFYGGATVMGLTGYRQHASQQRQRFNSSSGWDFGGGMTARFDLGFVRSLENLPGALTRPQFEADPQQRNPSTAFANEQRNYNYPNGAFTFRLPVTENQQVVSLTQLNYQDLFHPLSFAIIDQTTYNWSQEIRYVNTASIGGHRNLLTAGFQYFATQQNDAQQQNLGNANARRLSSRTRSAASNNYGFYGEDVFAIVPSVSLVAGLRLQYSTRAVRDRLYSDPFPDVDGNDSGSVDFFGASPKFGAIWQLTPTIQVYGNASRAFQPPLLLELTAPGQIPGTLDDLKATYAWQFEIGTRGSWGERASWDISVYDYEVWDAVQNVNVQPFPGAPFTIPRFQNIPRLSQPRRRGGARRPAALRPGPLPASHAGGRPGARPAGLHLLELSLREQPDVRQQLPARRPRALHPRGGALRERAGLLRRAPVRERPQALLRQQHQHQRDLALHPLRHAAGLHLQALEPERLFPGDQPDRQVLHLGRRDRRRPRPILLPRRRARLLRRSPVEVVMRCTVVRAIVWSAAAALALHPSAPWAAGLTPGQRVEIAHPGTGHEIHLSAPAVAVASDGQPLVAWMAQAGHGANVWVARPGAAESAPVRVNPEGLQAESLHQSPGLAAGPGGVTYVSWTSLKPKPPGVLFASDLQLSRSMDGARTFGPPAARERRPADLALLRGARHCRRRHRAGGLDRCARGRGPAALVSRPDR